MNGRFSWRARHCAGLRTAGYNGQRLRLAEPETAPRIPINSPATVTRTVGPARGGDCVMVTLKHSHRIAPRQKLQVCFRLDEVLALVMPNDAPSHFMHLQQASVPDTVQISKSTGSNEALGYTTTQSHAYTETESKSEGSASRPCGPPM